MDIIQTSKYIYFFAVRNIWGGVKKKNKKKLTFGLCIYIFFFVGSACPLLNSSSGSALLQIKKIYKGREAQKNKCIPKAGREAGRLAGQAISIWVLYPPTS
jgi:hypothetical protein